MQEKESIMRVGYGWTNHSAEPRNAKTMTLGTVHPHLTLMSDSFILSEPTLPQYISVMLGQAKVQKYSMAKALA